ncbi:hypothetical protein H8356DRAFT_1353426 [Neocallimastix lanati (nom. inval.)]|nr:hypothetical protein H8356DRAFT_1353426 [Neocallimastix sp. JGI-2020a]
MQLGEMQHFNNTPLDEMQSGEMQSGEIIDLDDFNDVHEGENDAWSNPNP